MQHLALLPDSKVDVVMEIQAEIPDGTPDQVVRTVTENCRTLKRARASRTTNPRRKRLPIP